MQKIENILFDFDGVLAESNNVKTNAFGKLYMQYGSNIVKKVLAHHKENEGMSRYEKFPIYHKDYLNIVLSDNEINKLSDKFSKIVLDDVVKAKEVLGAKWFLEKYYRDIKFWIVSATPIDELEIIVEKRGLSNYFEGISGSPEKKDNNVKKIIIDNSLNKNATIFLGDAINDFKAATRNKIKFVLRETKENKDVFEKFKALKKFETYYELENILKLYS